jgi:hypothetical protein
MINFLSNVEREMIGLSSLSYRSNRLILLHRNTINETDYFYYITPNGYIRGRRLKVHPAILDRNDLVEIASSQDGFVALTSSGDLFDSSSSRLLFQNVATLESPNSLSYILRFKNGKWLDRQSVLRISELMERCLRSARIVTRYNSGQ